MRVNFAHLRERARSGGWINFAVFDARSSSGSSSDNSQLLAQLTAQARASNLQVDQSALAFTANGRLQFFGSPNLVDYLSRAGLPQWTHSFNV
ncbi:hypothetical protein AB4Z27_15740 [Cupriavidus sp. KB_39]|jgi:hypothetical protein|uniref:hypothetical protein n=1 Tax=Cupriavidus sp. KB_39 TaxID=3233036 RepID=UPI003F9385DC